MRSFAAFLLAGVSALVGVALGLGALFVFLVFVLETELAELLTWGAVGMLVLLNVLAIGAAKCIRYAAKVLEQPT